ncbi:MAG TPA: PEP-CTERM sorting domain-containing protein, partial [Phycisphaerae bacterium]|nr:PEP-CTERM sorting domain-containing protein [Phycisphaerae bacterium]
DISYNYYINTATFSGATFLQVGTFWNQGDGYYAQNYGSPDEVQLSGAQIASGAIFTGTVTINVGAIYSPVAGDTFYRLGLVENADSTSTGVGVYFTDISVSPVAVPEPASLALFGLGLAAGTAFLRRRKA